MARVARMPANAPCDLAATQEQLKHVLHSPRDIGVNSLMGLLIFSQQLATWVAQFDPKSPATLLAAGAVGMHGTDALLAFIEDELRRLAPYVPCDTGERPLAALGKAGKPKVGPACGGVEKSATSQEWRDAQRQLCRTLNSVQYLRELVAGNLRMEPDLRNPHTESPESVPWCWTWEPADQEAAAIAEAWFGHFPKHELLRRGVAEAQVVHDKIALQGRNAVLNLVEQMNSVSSSEGFPRVRAEIDAMPPGKQKARAKAALKKFEQLLRALADGVPEPEPGDPLPFGSPHHESLAVNLVERFIAAGRNYVAECLPLLEKKKGSLQAKRKKVVRWLAVVAQYAFLASSNGRFRRFAEIIAAVHVVSEYLQEDVVRLLDAVRAEQKANEQETKSMVRRMNALVLEPTVLKRWLAAFERAGSPKAPSYYGDVVRVIVASEGGQTTPWERGDVLPALSHAGLITATSQRKKIDAVTDVCFLMQQVGVAVQVPYEYLLGDGPPPAKRGGTGKTVAAHDGLPWIVNPLAASLADLGTTDAAKPPQGRRRKQPEKLRITGGPVGPAGKTRKGTTRKSGAGPKPTREASPPDHARPKAAQKWPRA